MGTGTSDTAVGARFTVLGPIVRMDSRSTAASTTFAILIPVVLHVTRSLTNVTFAAIPDVPFILDHSTLHAFAIGGTAIVSLPVVIVGAAMIADTENLKHNFEVKELRRQTVSSGKSVQGFIYYSAKVSIPQRLRMTAIVTDIDTARTISIPVTFDVRKD